MRISKLIVFTALLLCAFALNAAHAQGAQGDDFIVKGLVVSSGNGLIINDGTRDYILIGVDNIGLEGTVCEVSGTLTTVNGMPAIDVLTVSLIGKEYPADDKIGFGKGRQTLPGRGDAPTFPAAAMESPGIGPGRSHA